MAQSVCRAVFLKLSTTADHYMSSRRMLGSLVCHNVPLSNKRNAIDLSFAIRRQIILKLSFTHQLKYLRKLIQSKFFNLNDLISCKSRDITVGTETGYGLDDL